MSLMDIYNSVLNGTYNPESAFAAQQGGSPYTAAAPQAAPAAEGSTGPQYATQSATNMWKFGDDNSLLHSDVGSAPTYNDVFTKFMGNDYMTGYDPALATTLNAGGQGQLASGIGAFLNPNTMANFNSAGGATSSKYTRGDLESLANRFGVSTAGDDLESRLDDSLKDYYKIGGMSSGWNNTGDARQGNVTLYQRQNGKLVPIQTAGGHLPEQGNYIQEHPGILAPLAVATGGLAYGAMAGAGAAGAGASGAAAGSTGAATGAATGATAGAGGLGGSVANALGLGAQWGALPGYAQGAITGAGMGGVSSGLQGGNIFQGMLLGGLTGGLGSGISSGLQGAGLSSGMSSGLGRLGANMLVGGARGGDLGSMFQNGVMNMGAGYLGNQIGLGGALAPTDYSLQSILARLAAQQGGSMLASRIDPRLGGLGGMAGTGLASLYNRV